MTSLSKTYYVSSKTGNDSNDGLTSESAFASLFSIREVCSREIMYYLSVGASFADSIFK